MRFFKKGPFGRFSPLRGSTILVRPTSSAILSLQEDSSNYCLFSLKGAASGGIGNRYKALLYNRSPATGLFWFKIWDETDSVVGTTIQATTMVNMPAAIAANAATGSVVTMRIVGSIANSTAFATNANLADATNFVGGFK
jgi:hypothetical protein